jgi:hypothetical protein
MKIKNWYTLKELELFTGKSDRTIQRKRNKVIKDNPDTGWFKTKTKPYKYHLNFLEVLIPQHFFEMITRSKQMENTITCMQKVGTLEHHLSLLDWDYFVTIAYEDNLSSQKCFAAMNELYEYMEAYAFSATTRMFFTTEPFANRYGHHNHLVIKTKGNKEMVEKFIKKYAPNGRIHIKPYDPFLAGVFYSAKEKHKGDDWDLLGNNLKAEGAILEIKKKIA